MDTGFQLTALSIEGDLFVKNIKVNCYCYCKSLGCSPFYKQNTCGVCIVFFCKVVEGGFQLNKPSADSKHAHIF